MRTEHRPSRSRTYGIVLALFVVAACDGKSDVKSAQDSTRDTTRVAAGPDIRGTGKPWKHVTKADFEPLPDSLRGQFLETDEAVDIQQIVHINVEGVRKAIAAYNSSKSTSQAATKANGPALFDIVAATGRVAPTVDLIARTVDTYRNAENANPVRLLTVAELTLSEEVDGLPAGNSIFSLHLRNGTWFATNSRKPGITFHVTRYSYAPLGRTEFPNTARFDWSEAGDRLLVGVPCAGAWCLINTDANDNAIVDPLDNPQLPRTRRIRGWYDRQFNLRTGHWAYIYPSLKMNSNGNNDFKVNTDVVEVVEVGVKTRRIVVKYDSTLPIDQQWDGLYSGAWNSFGWAEHNDLTRPGAARWQQAYTYDRAVGGSRHGGAPPAVRTYTDDELGDMWVRCGSGCCQANLIS